VFLVLAENGTVKIPEEKTKNGKKYFFSCNRFNWPQMRRISLKKIPYDQNSFLGPNLKIRENRNFQKKSKNLKKNRKKVIFKIIHFLGKKFRQAPQNRVFIL
jgi:Ni,Fe-hydrogenase maturation factor